MALVMDLTQNRFDYEWARNSILDGQVGFKFDKYKNKVI